jgi:hypothetical protein
MPLELVHANHKRCVEIYGRDAHLYLEREIQSFRLLMQEFLDAVPAGGTKGPAVRRKVTEVKRAFRDLAKWDQFFSTVKNHSFPASLQRTFDLEGHPRPGG